MLGWFVVGDVVAGRFVVVAFEAVIAPVEAVVVWVFFVVAVAVELAGLVIVGYRIGVCPQQCGTYGFTMGIDMPTGYVYGYWDME